MQSMLPSMKRFEVFVFPTIILYWLTQTNNIYSRDKSEISYLLVSDLILCTSMKK